MSDTLLEHYFKNTPTAGRLDTTQASVKFSKSGSAGEGVLLELYFLVDEKNNVMDARFRAHGCGYLIAAASYVTQEAVGKHVACLKDYSAEKLVTLFAMPERKLYVALMMEDGLNRALSSFAIATDLPLRG